MNDRMINAVLMLLVSLVCLFLLMDNTRLRQRNLNQQKLIQASDKTIEVLRGLNSKCEQSLNTKIKWRKIK